VGVVGLGVVGSGVVGLGVPAKRPRTQKLQPPQLGRSVQRLKDIPPRRQ
jgi:hypothetical protein